MHNKQDYLSIAELIRGFLEEIELVTYDELPECDEIAKKIKKPDIFDKGASSAQLDCVPGEEQSIFVYYNKERTMEEMLESAISGITGELSKLHVVFFTATVQELMELKAAPKEIIDKTRKCINKRSLPVRVHTIHAPKKEKPIFPIEITSRIRKLEHVSEDKAGVKIGADVYVAKLYDIVEMYSQIGAELFERNVRYHIRDVMEVESEIKKTLENNPSGFFNLNNGIAMQVKNTDGLDRHPEKDIRAKYSNCGDISIINGAQTISAATEFFFEPVKAEDKEKREKAIKEAKKKAFVLLRVFYPVKGPGKDYLPAFEKISISLNRQKPINPIDVAYYCKEVMQINALYEQNRNDPFYFGLLKRGQKTSGLFQYQLSEFGRIVKAYYHNVPGQARTESIDKIIQHPDTDGDQDKSKIKNVIYAPIQKTPEDKDVFMKWYKPVNFANEIAKLYAQVDKQNRNHEEISENTRSILSNGRYFFIAYVVRVLNAKNTDNFEADAFKNFAYTAANVKNKHQKIKKHIMSFAELATKCAAEFLSDTPNNRTVLNSNDFKKDDFYKAWCNFAATDMKVTQWSDELQHILEDKTQSNDKQ